MGKKVIMLFLILSSSTSFVASEVSSREDSIIEQETVETEKVETENVKENSVARELNSRTTTTYVIKNYNGNQGETLTQYFTNNVKTSAMLTNSSGKKIRSWSYYSNGQVKISYYWNGTIKLTATEYNSNGDKIASYKYHSNNEIKENISYYSNGNKKLERTFDNKGYKLTHIEYLSNGQKSFSYTFFSNTNNIYRRQKFSNNILVETQERYENGTALKYLWTYQSNGKVIKQKVYYNASGIRLKTEDRWANGNLKYVWTYTSNGNEVSTKIIYDESGNRLYTNTYSGGVINGRISHEDFIVPLKNAIKTSGFGDYPGHKGLDLQSTQRINGIPAGDVLAAASGKIVKSGWSSYGYGNHVVIDHGNGLYTLYAHMRSGSLTKNVGDYVVQGEKLGIEGRTGNVSGPTGYHLHFEISTSIYNGQKNPENYLPKLKSRMIVEEQDTILDEAYPNMYVDEEDNVTYLTKEESDALYMNKTEA